MFLSMAQENFFSSKGTTRGMTRVLKTMFLFVVVKNGFARSHERYYFILYNIIGALVKLEAC